MKYNATSINIFYAVNSSHCIIIENDKAGVKAQQKCSFFKNYRKKLNTGTKYYAGAKLIQNFGS